MGVFWKVIYSMGTALIVLSSLNAAFMEAISRKLSQPDAQYLEGIYPLKWIGELHYLWRPCAWYFFNRVHKSK